MYQVIIILIASVAFVFAGTISDYEIVKDCATSIEYHPYQVSIQKERRHFCGGSLYRRDIVITAAHCLQAIKVEDLTVRVGSTDRKQGGQVIKVKNYKTHPSFNKTTYSYDVAVIRLEKKATQNSFVRFIKLATSTPRTGTSAISSGWELESSGELAGLLQVKVKIVGYKKCRSSRFKYGNSIDSSMICVMEASKDSYHCDLDSGGALVSGNKLVGVASWGYGCGQPEYPAVYADVTKLYSWIVNSL